MTLVLENHKLINQICHSRLSPASRRFCYKSFCEGTDTYTPWRKAIGLIAHKHYP